MERSATIPDAALDLMRRFFENPMLSSFTPLQREERIIQLLGQQGDVLAPRLIRDYFPGSTWNQVLALLVPALRNVTNEALFPRLEEIVRGLSWKFLALLDEKPIPHAQVADQVLAFLRKVLARQDARLAFTGPSTALFHRVLDRYLEAICAERGYVYFELSKVERLSMGKEELGGFLSTLLLLRPALYLLTPDSGTDFRERVSGVVRASFAERLSRALAREIPLLPAKVVEAAVLSHVSFEENPGLPASSRLVAVFSHRCRSYRPDITVDRGAESPDRSWFAAARRTWRLYGFDLKMLDELYRISAEYGW
ncbi:hypothetical protein [Spirochaeta thermophila]|nr:hypothetical protein [Spirochaeta thermophila]